MKLEIYLGKFVMDLNKCTKKILYIEISSLLIFLYIMALLKLLILDSLELLIV